MGTDGAVWLRPPAALRKPLVLSGYWRNPDSILAGFWHPCQVGVHFGVHRRSCLFNPLCINTLEMEPVAGLGLRSLFSYEENMGFSL